MYRQLSKAPPWLWSLCVVADIGPPAHGAARLLSGVQSLRRDGELIASLVPALVAAPWLRCG